jgi:phosphopantetheine--protein transferase-like protein
MDKQSTLLQIVAEFVGIDPRQLGPDFPFTGSRFQGSLARTQLYAAIQRRLGVKCQAVYTARTYGELQAAVCGTGVGASSAVPGVQASGNGSLNQLLRYMMIEGSKISLSCGIDIEMVNHFPVVQDYWEDAFYTTAFTPTEIAYCLLQENPRMHFAARWCVKEALKKCDPVYLHKEMGHFEVAFEKEGTPFLRHYNNGTAERLPFAVSLSHTPEIAVAVVVRLTEPGRSGERSSPEWETPQSNPLAKSATKSKTI